MTEVSASEVNGVISSELGVSGGPLTGFGAHYKIKDNKPIDFSAGKQNHGVEVQLDEKSLDPAKKAAGMPTSEDKQKKGNDRGLTSPLHDKVQQGADDQVVQSYGNNLMSAVQRGSTFRQGSRPNYRTQMSPKFNPLRLVHERRRLELRRAINQILAVKTKAIPINPENLSRETISRMAEEAVQKGETKTAVGSIEKTLKAAGRWHPSDSLVKAYARWENAGALFPESYKSTPKPTKST